MKQILLIISITFIFFYACTDGDSLVDSNGKHFKNYAVLYKDTLTAINSISQEYGKVSTGQSPRLLLGAYKGFEGRFLVKFSLPADTINVDSVYFLIQSVDNYGTGVQDFTGSIKLVTQDWDANVNTDESWSNQNNVLHTEFTTDFNVSTDDSLPYSISIPDTIVSIWRDSTDNIENNGLMLDFENATTIKEFSSRNSTISPKIVYVYHNAADSVIRDTLNATLDASVVDFDGNMPNDSLLYITSGFAHRAFIEFDLDLIPKDIEISSVNFIIKSDTIASDVSDGQSRSFYFRTVTTPFSDLPLFFEVDSTFNDNLFRDISLLQNDEKNFEISSTRRGETGKYFIHDFITEKTKKKIEYGSFLVHFVGEGNTVSIQAIKGTDGISESNRPKMIIEYLKIPDSRL